MKRVFLVGCFNDSVSWRDPKPDEADGLWIKLSQKTKSVFGKHPADSLNAISRS